ncbi:MAG: tail fiber domain-containing protein, partial [Candidatus Pacebacteria bacterium]|nr:tail fiber domain-containing protein [Candidatus Paceibacterota bacterium]
KMAVSTATSVLHATEVLAGFDTVVFDQGGITDVAQKRFVIKRAGKYLVSAFWTAKNLDIGESAEAIVYKNGSTQVLIAKTHSATTNQRVTAGGAQVVELQAGDYLTMVIQQFEGATQVSSTNEGERIEMSVTEVGRVQNTGGSSLFTDGGSNSYLTDTADNLLIGTTTNSVNAKFVLRQQNAFDIINIFDGSTEVFSILDGGNVGIGTTSPYAKLSVNGNIALTGGIYDSGASLGTNGMVLLSTGTGVDWVATSSLGITGGGGLTTSDIDTSSELAAILGDETGTAGAVVFSTSPTFTGTVNAAAATLSSTLTLSGSAANIALGSNYLSGDGGDEGIYVDATGRIGIGTTTPYRALELHSAVSGSAVVRLDEPNPRYEWRESDASSNNKLWRAEANGSVWSIAVQNDALTQTNPVLSIGRSGSTPGNIYTADVRLGLNDSTPDFRLEATGTVGSGYFGVTNSTDGDIFIINGSGNVGIGTTTPSQKLQVFGNIRVGTSGSNGCLEDFGGGLIAGTCSSDENLKENIVPIAEDGRSYLESLTALTPVTYNWNEEASELYSKDVTVENLGLIAQDVEEQFPELVTLNDEGYHQVDFRAFPFYIIEAIKELWIKVQGHDERLGELEDENEYLRERIETIENELNVNTSPPPDLEPVLEEGPIDPEGDAPSDEPDPVEPEVPLVPEASE